VSHFQGQLRVYPDVRVFAVAVVVGIVVVVIMMFIFFFLFLVPVAFGKGNNAALKLVAVQQTLQEGLHVWPYPEDGVSVFQGLALGRLHAVVVGAGARRHQSGDIYQIAGNGFYQQFNRFDGGNDIRGRNRGGGNQCAYTQGEGGGFQCHVKILLRSRNVIILH